MQQFQRACAKCINGCSPTVAVTTQSSFASPPSTAPEEEAASPTRCFFLLLGSISTTSSSLLSLLKNAMGAGRRLWRDILGPPVVGYGKDVVSRMRKPQRVDDTLLFEFRVDDLGDKELRMAVRSLQPLDIRPLLSLGFLSVTGRESWMLLCTQYLLHSSFACAPLLDASGSGVVGAPAEKAAGEENARSLELVIVYGRRGLVLVSGCGGIV